MSIYPSDINDWPQHMLTKPTKNICDAITELNLWPWMKNESPPPDQGYCFWGHSNLKLIEKDKAVSDDCHSVIGSFVGAAGFGYLAYIEYKSAKKTKQNN